MLKYKLILSFAVATLSTLPALGVTASPSSVKITVYAVAVSTNADCSSPKLVSTYPSGQEFDFLQNPTIMTGDLVDGTYPCVILKMSDVIKLTPATSIGTTCVAGTEYSQSVCRAGTGQKYNPMTVNSDNSITFGSATNCTGNEAVPLFMSTTSTSSSTNLRAPFEQPIASNAADCNGGVATGCGANLTSAFVVSGTTTGTFVVNFDNAVDIQDGACSVEAPVFGFR